MEILLEELYKTDLHAERYQPRKLTIPQTSCHIMGITNSGKSTLVKNYLLARKKNTYLYIDAHDIRLETLLLNQYLENFCKKNSIEILVIDNYDPAILLPNIPQIITISQLPSPHKHIPTLQLFPLDYEEFLAFEYKYDSTALKNFFVLGGFTSMHTLQQDQRVLTIQRILRCSLHDIEFALLVLCAKFNSQKISPFNLYERLKQTRKISKDKTYRYFQTLQTKGYIHLVEKFDHAKAVKKVYLCDTFIKSALSTEKHFGRMFENIVFLELLKNNIKCYYSDDIDFYIPSNNEIILCKPFADERRLFKKLEMIEAFLFTHSIEKITVITMNKEGSITHPLSKVAIIPFDIWALGD